jgi:hypothetical protein
LNLNSTPVSLISVAGALLDDDDALDDAALDAWPAGFPVVAVPVSAAHAPRLATRTTAASVALIFIGLVDYHIESAPPA